MISFDIITDSCCDFTDAQYADLNVTRVPLSVRWDGTCRDHFSDESALRSFYEGMRRGVSLTTSALNPHQWARAMEPRLQAGRDLLVLAVSSGVSATYQSAVILRKEHGIKHILIGYVGPILGAHTGPGVLGLFHLGLTR